MNSDSAHLFRDPWRLWGRIIQTLVGVGGRSDVYLPLNVNALRRQPAGPREPFQDDLSRSPLR